MTYTTSHSEEQKAVLLAALRRKHRKDIIERFDSEVPGSRASPGQDEVLRDINKYKFRWVVCANQVGKTTIAARELAWLFEETHPYWERPAHWGVEPLLLLVFVRMREHFDSGIWRKIKPLLDPASYNTQPDSSGIKRIINKNNGNTILVMTHHHTGDEAEKAQNYVAHYAVIDEMPKEIAFVEEVMRRLSSRGGYFLATFTPKVRNDAIRRLVESATSDENSFAKKYQLHMFRDNPLYRDDPDKQKEVLASLAGQPEAKKRAVLYGDWYAAEGGVWSLAYGDVVRELPLDYSPMWRHVESVDPADQSKLGYVLFAEDPRTGIWYVTKTAYVEGVYAPSKIVEEVLKLSRGYNIVKRVYDPAASWYKNTAHEMRIFYVGVPDKNNRKMDLLAQGQEKLGSQVFITPQAMDLYDQLSAMEWSETIENKIVNSKNYHLYDAFVYGCDRLPKFDLSMSIINRDSWLRQYDDAMQSIQKQPGKIMHGGKLRRRRW